MIVYLFIYLLFISCPLAPRNSSLDPRFPQEQQEKEDFIQLVEDKLVKLGELGQLQVLGSQKKTPGCPSQAQQFPLAEDFWDWIFQRIPGLDPTNPGGDPGKIPWNVGEIQDFWGAWETEPNIP